MATARVQQPTAAQGSSATTAIAVAVSRTPRATSVARTIRSRRIASASRAVSQEIATYGSIRALPARPSSHGLSVFAATRTSSSGQGSATARAPMAWATMARRVVPSRRDISSIQEEGRQRGEPVEPHGRVAAGVGARREQPDLVALAEADRQVHHPVLVEHVGAVAGRPGQHARSRGGTLGGTLGGGGDPVADRLLEGLDQPGEDAGVEVDPAHPSPVDDTDDRGDESPGVTHDAASRLDQGLGAVLAEGVSEVAVDGFAVRRDRAAALLVGGREAATEVQDGGEDPAGAEQPEDARGGRDRSGPRLGVALLRPYVEGDAGRLEAQLVGEGEHLDRLVRRAAVLA